VRSESADILFIDAHVVRKIVNRAALSFQFHFVSFPAFKAALKNVVENGSAV